jgi:hypothetical protein
VTETIEENRVRRRPRDRLRSSRIYYAADQPPSFLATWTSRLAVFAAAALIVTLVLHRALLLSTAVTITIAVALFAGAVLALIMALIAGLDIWVTGRKGAARVLCGAVLGLGLLALPAGAWVVSLSFPRISDVSTDLAEPPEFTQARDERGVGANPVDYPGERFAEIQRKNYPDIKSLLVPRSVEESYELVLQALTKLKLNTTLEVPPEDDEDSPGFIELTDRSLILGLADDIVIRVLADEKASRIDVRSASRYGSNDFGRNADHVRTILKEIAARFEASVPDTLKAAGDKKGDKSKAKQPKALGPASAANRRRPSPSRSGIRRGPERKASPPGSFGARGPGRSPGQFDE